MLHVEEVRCVMRPEVVFDRGAKPRRFVACRLNDVALERRQGRLHQLPPRVVITCLCGLLEHSVVTHRLHADQTQTAGKRLILRHGDIVRWHLLSQARLLLMLGGPHGFFHVTVHLLLGPIRRPHEPVQARQLQQQTHQANAASSHLDTHHMPCQDETMQESEPRRTVKKRHNRRTLVKSLLGRAPCLQRAAWYLQHFGRLALGNPLEVQGAIAFLQVSALAARPALVAIRLATVLVVDYRCHRLPPLPKPLPCEKWKDEGWRGSSLVAIPLCISQAFTRSLSRRDGRRRDRGRVMHTRDERTCRWSPAPPGGIGAALSPA